MNPIGHLVSFGVFPKQTPETNVLCLTVQKKGYNGKKAAEVKASMGNRG